MRIILFSNYEQLKLYIIFCIFRFLVNSSLYHPNFANVSTIEVKMRRFQVSPLMRILIVNACI